MAADDIGKINPQRLRSLTQDLIERVNALPLDVLGRFAELMIESSFANIREHERAIRDLAPGILWFEGVEIACADDEPDRKIYVINLLDWILEQQHRIRLLEARIDELTEQNIELAWRLENSDDSK